MSISSLIPVSGQESENKCIAEKFRLNAMPIKTLRFTLKFLDLEVIIRVSKTWKENVDLLLNEREKDCLRKQYLLLREEFVPSLKQAIKETPPPELFSEPEKLNQIVQQITEMIKQKGDPSTMQVESLKSEKLKLKQDIINILKNLDSTDLVVIKWRFKGENQLLFRELLELAGFCKRYDYFHQCEIEGVPLSKLRLKVPISKVKEGLSYDIGMAWTIIGETDYAFRIAATLAPIFRDSIHNTIIIQLVDDNKIQESIKFAEIINQNLSACAVANIFTALVRKGKFKGALECTKLFPFNGDRTKAAELKQEFQRKLKADQDEDGEELIKFANRSLTLAPDSDVVKKILIILKSIVSK